MMIMRSPLVIVAFVNSPVLSLLIGKDLAKEAETYSLADHGYARYMQAREAGSPANEFARIGASFSKDRASVGMYFKDHNGTSCFLCGKPPAVRMAEGQEYTEYRTDCGKLKPKTEGGAYWFKPLSLMTKSASETENGLPTNAFCEMNIQKSCVDAVANKDYLYYAKSIIFMSWNPARYWDFKYCKDNGFLQKEIVDLVHSGDFEAIKEKGEHLCNTKYEKYDWQKMTLSNMMTTYLPAFATRRVPTEEQSHYLGASNCAMGDLSCDMSYCAYTYCDLGDGEPRMYGKCPGWHPVHGMRH